MRGLHVTDCVQIFSNSYGFGTCDFQAILAELKIAEAAILAPKRRAWAELHS